MLIDFVDKMLNQVNYWTNEKNEKKFMRNSIRKAIRLVANLPVAKAYNKPYKRLVELGSQYSSK